jgi:hypothetical protein
MFNRFSFVALTVASLALAFTARAADTDTDAARETRQAVLRGTMGTYCRAPHTPDGRIDVKVLVEQLVDLKAKTYSLCIHTGVHDWDDLQLFLPLAREHGINVWASVVPPSESPPRTKLYAEPFRLDYQRWAVEFAKLSVREPNLVAWSIDDFSHNQKVYTPEHLKDMLDASRTINPKLAFIPCCYFKEITPEFCEKYVPLLDGILFPYRHESKGSNLKEWDQVQFEVKRVKELCGEKFPVCIDVYASAHSKLGPSTAEYVRQVMTLGRENADGVLVYCHQDPNTSAEKYEIIKELFTKWVTRAK